MTRIVHLKVRNFRGIKALDWTPSKSVNCLIGPGDSCKTTILDAIELALGQRTHGAAEDSDFYDLDVDLPIEIVVTLSELPPDLKSDARYGLQLRGWDPKKQEVHDEPDESLEDALSIRLHIDKTLEPHRAIYNSRIESLEEDDRPSVRYKDAQQFVPSRLGPYADRHLSWSRNSVLARLVDSPDAFSGHLAAAGRAARESFKGAETGIFKAVIKRVEELAKQFMVRSRAAYGAQLDIGGVNISAGGIALHDGALPLRRLGTGSARLIVSALQSEVSASRIALIDEIEHGLEPHRIARLLRFLKTSPNSQYSQLFVTSHSPVVIRELSAGDVFITFAKDGVLSVKSLLTSEDDQDFVQRQVRREAEAFLAKSILVGEGRTEVGFLREMDSYWSDTGKDAFAYMGIAIADGKGTTAPAFSKKLLQLGYRVLVLLDSDKPVPREQLRELEALRGVVVEWPDSCAIEHRVFADLPWDGVRKVIQAAVTFTDNPVGIKSKINAHLKSASLPEITDLDLAASMDTVQFRRALGCAALAGEWFKNVEGGEVLGGVVKGFLPQVAKQPLGICLQSIRNWADS